MRSFFREKWLSFSVRSGQVCGGFRMGGEIKCDMGIYGDFEIFMILEFVGDLLKFKLRSCAGSKRFFVSG